LISKVQGNVVKMPYVTYPIGNCGSCVPKNGAVYLLLLKGELNVSPLGPLCLFVLSSWETGLNAHVQVV
jgi:hypothetical protein